MKFYEAKHVKSSMQYFDFFAPPCIGLMAYRGGATFFAPRKVILHFDLLRQSNLLGSAGDNAARLLS